MSERDDHFPEATLQFLFELGMNNDRGWFKPRKQRYIDEVREPARAFIRAMGTRLAEIAPHFVADDRTQGGSLMRVYRDTRFSKEKAPYKTNVGVQFRHEAGKDVHAPGYYLHLSPEECFLGVGTWMPPSPALKAIRARIDEEPEAWKAAVDDPAVTSRFDRRGESLKRAPKGYSVDHPLIDELRLKSHILYVELPATRAETPGFADWVAEQYAAASPYMRFLCEALDVPF